MSVTEQARVDFSKTTDKIYHAVAEAGADVEAITEAVNQFQQSVFLKNEDAVLIATNHAFKRFHCENPTGRHAQSFLSESFQQLSRLTDEMILDGTDRLEAVHTGAAIDGNFYVMQIHKRSLAHLKWPGFLVMGVTQPEERVNHEKENVELARQAQLFRELDNRDREICRLLSLGNSCSGVGKMMDMTGRNVEMRRKKAFDRIGVDKTVDLVRLLVRLQERGHLDLGL